MWHAVLWELKELGKGESSTKDSPVKMEHCTGRPAER